MDGGGGWVAGEGNICSLANYSCIWRDSIKPRLRFSRFCVFLFVSKLQSFLTFFLIYSSWCCAVCGGRTNVSPYIIIVQVIFNFLWDHWAYHGYFENWIPPVLGAYAVSQTTVLHMKRLIQTESPIFVILCVLCFQRQCFFFFIFYCYTDNRPVSP